MKFASGTRTFSPTVGPPYTGEVDPSGGILMIGPDVFLYDPDLGAYSRQDTEPPQDWHYVWKIAEEGPLADTYLRGFASLPVTEMKHVTTEAGQYV